MGEKKTPFSKRRYSPQVQGYSYKGFGILTNPVGGNWWIERALQGFPILGVTLQKKHKSGPIWTLAEKNTYNHLMVSSSDCCEKLSR